VRPQEGREHQLGEQVREGRPLRHTDVCSTRLRGGLYTTLQVTSKKGKCLVWKVMTTVRGWQNWVWAHLRSGDFRRAWQWSTKLCAEGEAWTSLSGLREQQIVLERHPVNSVRATRSTDDTLWTWKWDKGASNWEEISAVPCRVMSSWNGIRNSKSQKWKFPEKNYKQLRAYRWAGLLSTSLRNEDGAEHVPDQDVSWEGLSKKCVGGCWVRTGSL
jgi:hypothetical protein